MRVDTPGGTLHRLQGDTLRLDDGRADIRGRAVVDAWGQELGSVGDLLVDDRDRKVRFLDVDNAESRFLLPVEAVIRVSGDRVYVNQTRDRVLAAPPYDPASAEETFLDGLYGFYGYGVPFWDADYDYPRYPYL